MPKSNSAQDVTDKLRSMILRGELEAGMSLHQEDLSRRLGVSRTPLREALVALAADGLVQLNPNRSATVFRPSADEVSNAYEVRAALEGLAITKAVVHFPVERIGELRAIIDEMDVTTDIIRFMQCNRMFHDLVYDYCGNVRLASLIGTLSTQLERYTMRTLAFAQERSSAQQDHRDLIQCILDRDVQRAREVVFHHLSTTTNTILRQLGSSTDVVNETAEIVKNAVASFPRVDAKVLGE